MPGNTGLRSLIGFVFGVLLLLGTISANISGQTTTGTILGTITDSSGGAVPDANIQVTNTGTGATQVATSDAQGRYRVPAVPVGTYVVQAQKTGFELVVQRGIAVSVGADLVVDFSLPVGQVTQSVTVEAAVPTVETTTAAISNLVEPVQMRELPLNGRGIEQLVLLAPGVTIMTAINSTSATFGFGNSYSVAGTRPEGVWELLDDNDVTNVAGRGSGAGALGTSLGIDSVAEFQMLTNTYSAQYGGAGSVVVSVTKSGTNSLHGSAYEFFRNSALDARNFFDPPTKPLFQKNQFGGTLGGPIKKEKMFFFANYEGLRQNSNVSSGNNVYTLPDAAWHLGYVPNAAGTAYTCANNATILYPNPTCLNFVPAAIQKMMSYIPLPNQYPTVALAPTSGTISGTVSTTETFRQPGTENYVVGRYDWTISQKDSVFARYLYDKAGLFEDTASPTKSDLAPNGWPTQDITKNQFISLEEKRIQTNSLILSSRVGYSRTLGESYLGADNGSVWQFTGNQNWGFPFTENGGVRMRQTQNPNFPTLFVGVAQSGLKWIQNKYSAGEDIFWSKGAHGLRFGGSVTRVQTYSSRPPTGGTWTFATLKDFLTMTPQTYDGSCLGQLFATCAANGYSSNPVKPNMLLQTIYGVYFQDDWKLTNTLTLNLGLRYEPESNPRDAFNNLASAVNLPLQWGYNPNLPMPGCTAAARSSCSATSGVLAQTPISTVYAHNPTFRNLDPRIGIAWDPFKDHKTSVRAGYGIFHTSFIPYDLESGFNNNPPGTTVTQNCTPIAGVPGGTCSSFPTPFQANSFGQAALVTSANAIDPGINVTSYIQQYNLSVQRGIGSNTTVTVAYVGSHGVHLGGSMDLNPPLPTGVPGAITECASGCTLNPATQVLLPYPAVGQLLTGTAAPAAANGQAIVDPTTGRLSYANVVCPVGFTSTTTCSVVQNNRVDPALGFYVTQTTGFWSRYNSVQGSIVRRFANNFQAQASYTFSSCIATSSNNGYSGGQGIMANPWDTNDYDRGQCTFSVRDNFYVNGVYILPLLRNRRIGGWQVSGIFSHHTGNAMFVSNGWDSGLLGRTGVPQEQRPDYVPGCDMYVKTVAHWINGSCFTQPPIGEPGNVANNTITGPSTNELDFSLTKNTKLTELVSMQFRAEAFNLFNAANFRNPGQPGVPVFAKGTVTAACATTPSACSIPLSNVGQIRATDTTSRQIQLGMKFTF